jgi:hypothetical protein
MVQNGTTKLDHQSTKTINYFKNVYLNSPKDIK